MAGVHAVAVRPDIASTVVLPAGHADEDRLFDAYAWLRANNPLGLAQVAGYDPLWLVSKHADIMEIERQPDVFTSGGAELRGSHNPILQNRAGDDFIRSVNGGSLRIGNSIIYMDPPEHSEVKDIAAAWFRLPSVAKLDTSMRELAQTSLDTRLRRGANDIDFATDFASHYPLRVVMALLGIPEEDEPLMRSLTRDVFGADDPEVAGGEAAHSSAGERFVEAVLAFNRYFDAVIDDRRASPREDLSSAISLARDPSGEYYNREYAYGWFSAIASGGHDSISSTLATIIERLGLDPALLAETKSDLDGTVDSLVEEGLRWASPVKHVVRRATRDYDLRGRSIRKDDRLMLLYQSANRDEAVFDCADAFDIRRRPNPHIAFGFGPHMCVGQQLVRRELRIMLEVLLPRVRSIELKPGRRAIQTNFVGGLKRLPLRLVID